MVVYNHDMRLSVIHVSDDPTSDDLVRLYHRTQLHWRRHLGEETMLECGAAIANASLGQVHEANCVLDAAAPPDMTPQQTAREADAHFEQNRSRCVEWVLNPASSEPHARPLIAYLLNHGYAVQSREILHARGHSLPPIDPTPGLTIIPARASFRHARQLAEESAKLRDNMQLVEAAMLHLDDPHVDALLALKEGACVAGVSVLAVGDIGCIEDLFVSENFRGHGVARTMLSRAMEICARSLFKHIFISADDVHADRTLLSHSAFARVGTYNTLRRSALAQQPFPA